MENQDDLIQALLQEGIDPSHENIEKLNIQITDLAEFLIDYWASKHVKNEKLKNEKKDKPTVDPL